VTLHGSVSTQTSGEVDSCNAPCSASHAKIDKSQGTAFEVTAKKLLAYFLWTLYCIQPNKRNVENKPST